VNFIDPTGLSSCNASCREHHNNDDFAFMGAFGGCHGLVEGVPVPCRFADTLLQSGAACVGDVCVNGVSGVNGSGDPAHGNLPGMVWLPADCISTSEYTAYGKVEGSAGSNCEDGSWISWTELNLLYGPDAGAIAASMRAYVQASLPTICGGGVFVYAGKGVEIAGFKGFTGGIGEF
jgi:hypothetical protein